MNPVSLTPAYGATDGPGALAAARPAGGRSARRLRGTLQTVPDAGARAAPLQTVPGRGGAGGGAGPAAREPSAAAAAGRHRR